MFFNSLNAANHAHRDSSIGTHHVVKYYINYEIQDSNTLDQTNMKKIEKSTNHGLKKHYVHILTMIKQILELPV